MRKLSRCFDSASTFCSIYLRITMKLFFFILLLSPWVSSRIEMSSMQVKNLKLTKCDDTDYPVIVDNVRVQLATKPRFKVSGSLSSKIDLNRPITASVLLKRHVLGIWIHIPCEGNIGSCTYDDLCAYGYPTNVTCSQIFIDNNVPCRCPISKGNYTIAPGIPFTLSQQTSILSGTYWARIKVTQNNLLLSCYYAQFVLYEQYTENSLYSVIQV